MPRERTHGERIQIQLPLHVDTFVREQAERNGMSPGLFLARWIERRVMEKVQGLGEVANGECAHTNYSITNGGLRKCRDCPAVRNMQGEWI